MPLVRRTRATFRSAELGFFGVVVYTRVHTPRRCGAAIRFLRPWPDFRPGVASFFLGLFRPLRTSWFVLGMRRAMLAGERPGSGGLEHPERRPHGLPRDAVQTRHRADPVAAGLQALPRDPP